MTFSQKRFSSCWFIFQPFRRVLGWGLPGGNFRCPVVGKAVGSYDIEFISYDPAILEIIEG